MVPKTEKQPFLADFLINYKHIAWSDKICIQNIYGTTRFVWGLSEKYINSCSTLFVDRIKLPGNSGLRENVFYDAFAESVRSAISLVEHIFRLALRYAVCGVYALYKISC